MCGFVVSNKPGVVREGLIRQRHRGPDAVSMWKGQGLEMGHVLLDINGSKTIQPYTTKKGNVLVFNGEMYNCPIENDTAWLGEGMDRYGIRFLEYNNWHGAVAYLDREKNELLVTRDHFGAKPLWFQMLSPTEWMFSTSLRSMVHKKVDEKHKSSFLFNPIWPGGSCPYQNTWKVAAGQTFKFDLNNPGERVHKNLWDYYRIESRRFKKERIREKLITSIQSIAKNKQKTGIFLSGGLDSTFALSAVKDMGLDLTAYILAYDEKKGAIQDHDTFRNESKMAIQTCKEWNIPYKVATLHEKDVEHYGKMWMNYTHFPWTDRLRQAPRFLLAKTASEDGCKVILTGDSADELFTGYYHHDKRFEEGYDDETVKRAEKMNWTPHKIWHKTDHWNNGLFFDLLVTSEQNVLAADQTCGMFGMESRPVFLQQDFVRWIFEQDGEIKFKTHPDYAKGTYKYILRELLGDMLPEHVRNRKQKTGWSSPWNNNVEKLQEEWRNQDWETLKSYQ